MVVMTWYSFTEENITLPSISVKKICTIVVAAALVTSVILSMYNMHLKYFIL